MVFYASNNIGLIIVLSIYQVIFIAFLVMAEFKVWKARLYFDFLNSKTGRSGFIAFTELLIIDGTGVVIIIIGIIVFFLALAGVIFGWSQGPDDIVKGPST